MLLPEFWDLFSELYRLLFYALHSVKAGPKIEVDDVKEEVEQEHNDDEAEIGADGLGEDPYEEVMGLALGY